MGAGTVVKNSNISTTSNTDASVTNSNNPVTNNNLVQTRATSNVYNRALDVNDAFNTVKTFNFSGIGTVGGQSDKNPYDILGLKALTQGTTEILQGLNFNTISKDPNISKNQFDFTKQSGVGEGFFNQVFDGVQSTFKEMVKQNVSSNPANVQAGSNSLMVYALLALVGLIAFLKFK